jgi:hypothetical protein
VGGAWPLPAGGLAAPAPLGSAALLPPAWGLLLRLMIQQVTASGTSCNNWGCCCVMAAIRSSSVALLHVLQHSGEAAYPGLLQGVPSSALKVLASAASNSAPSAADLAAAEAALWAALPPGCRGAWEAARHASASQVQSNTQQAADRWQPCSFLLITLSRLSSEMLLHQC